jgi:hypothetical protein
MLKPHKHRDLIIAWAKGAPIEFFHESREVWEIAHTPSWEPLTKYRLKPLVKSSLTTIELIEIVKETSGDFRASYTAIADAAVQRYIDDQRKSK